MKSAVFLTAVALACGACTSTPTQQFAEGENQRLTSRIGNK
jgi:hypothetical protein